MGGSPMFLQKEREDILRFFAGELAKGGCVRDPLSPGGGGQAPGDEDQPIAAAAPRHKNGGSERNPNAEAEVPVHR